MFDEQTLIFKIYFSLNKFKAFKGLFLRPYVNKHEYFNQFFLCAGSVIPSGRACLRKSTPTALATALIRELNH